MNWTIEDDERELRLYVQRKIENGKAPESISHDDYLESVRRLWDMLPVGVRQTINALNLATEVDRPPHERKGNVHVHTQKRNVSTRRK